jgi:hypothetical protein
VVECAGATAACATVTAELKAVGVPVANQGLGGGSGNDSLSVLVGTWKDVRPAIAADLIALGPARSGVYARFSGGSLQLLDSHGNVARTLGPGSGLIAATRDNVSAPTWLITGTDLGGVSAAASALTPARLRDHFALAVQGSSDIPLPVPQASP